jgi:hypothetical protein
MIDEALLDRHLSAENAHDLDGIMATYGEAPYIVLNGKRLDGVEKLREFHRAFGFGGSARYAEVHVAERARHRAADAIVVEQTLSGMQPSTGRRFSVAVCTVYRFDDGGRLKSEDVYFDQAWLDRQLNG